MKEQEFILKFKSAQKGYRDIEIKINDPAHQSSEFKALEMYEYDFKI